MPVPVVHKPFIFRDGMTFFTHRILCPAFVTLLMCGSVSGASADERTIYGNDDRIDWYEETNPERLALARSTCMIRSGAVQDNQDGTYTMSGPFPTSVYLEPLGVVPLCESERFGNQPLVGACSAFLVAADIVATAGHCVGSNPVSTKFVFNVYMIDEKTPRVVINEEDLYYAVELLGRVPNTEHDGEDWALLRLDRPVTSPGAVPLPIRRSGEISVGEKVGMIGHPLGLPSKIAWGDDTIVRDISRPKQFNSNLDAYGGNSGSAVFNQATGIVEGIAFGGDDDYVLAGDCATSYIVPDDEGAGTGVMKSTVGDFASLIPVASPAGPPEIDDSAGGNADGFIDRDDEYIEIRFPVRNAGETVLVGVSAEFSSSDSNVVSLGNNLVVYPEMNPGTTRTADAPFVFRIQSDHDFGMPVPVTISLTLPDDGGKQDYTYMLATEPGTIIETEIWIIE